MRRRLLFVAGVAVSLPGLFILTQCASSEDESVDLVTSCDVSKLRANDPAEVTARLFVEAADELAAKVTDLDKRTTEICNTINRESGETEGADLRTACNKIAARLNKARESAPDAAAGQNRALWVKVIYPEDCTADTQAEAECLSQCGSPGCAFDQACAAGNRSGACAGPCNGTCAQKGENLPCVGACQGNCATVDGGSACTGAECIGTCTAATWTGFCKGACNAGFRGQCGGTCTGTCDGAPINPQPIPDAGGGGGDAGGDGGDAGGDAGRPPDAAAPVAPVGNDANCKGLCTGQCSSLSSGTCTTRCTGAFVGGGCATCIGTCTAPAFACLTTCTGQCTTDSKGAECGGGGTCAVANGAGCGGPVTGAQCASPLQCDANDQCRRVCRAKAAIKTKCPIASSADTEIAGDVAIYQAVKDHAAEFGALANEALLVNTATAPISGVTLEDYRKIGGGRDRLRICVTGAAKKVDETRKTLAITVGAAQALRGTTF